MEKWLRAKRTLEFVLLFLSFLVPIGVYGAFGSRWDYNTNLWWESGRIADEHGLLNVYEVENGMPEKFNSGSFAFPPPWLAVSYAVYKFSLYYQAPTVMFAYLIRFLPLVFLLLSNYLVFVYLRQKRDFFFAAIGCSVYSLFFGVVNWFALITHGQMDAIPVFFTLLAFVLAEEGKKKYAVLSLGLGAAFKLYPLVIALGFIARERARSRNAPLVKYALLSLAPLVLVSLPYLITNATAYVDALTLWGGWAGWASMYAWLYVLLGVPTYLGNYAVQLSEAQSSVVFILTALSILATAAALALSYLKTAVRKTDWLETFLLPVMALLAFWKFVDANFLTWALPFAFVDAYTKRPTIRCLVWLFFAFYVSLMLFGSGLSPMLPFAQLGAILYFGEIMGRKTT